VIKYVTKAVSGEHHTPLQWSNRQWWILATKHWKNDSEIVSSVNFKLIYISYY